MMAVKENPAQDLYQTYQHSVHGNFVNAPKPDPKVIADQKMRLSKSNFQMGGSPAVYTSTNLSEHPPKSGPHVNKDDRIAV